MKNLKFLLVIILSVLITGCQTSTKTNSSSNIIEFNGEPLPNKEITSNSLVVGVPEMNGDFIEGFINSVNDYSIKTLTSGYTDTYEQTSNGELILNNAIIETVNTSLDTNKNKIYTFKLKSNLKWNNGDNLTAKDYVAGILWQTSPQWQSVGAVSTIGINLLGYENYHAGHKVDINNLAVDENGATIEVISLEKDENGELIQKSNIKEIKDKIIPVTNFEGVKLIDDLTFSLTIKAEKTPCFWEHSYLIASPIHMPTYMPNATVNSSDDGAYFTYANGSLLEDAERISNTERFSPTITAGPYKFVSYKDKAVTLELNNYFNGDINGKKPTINNITQKIISNSTDIDMVLSGEVDLISHITDVSKIEKAKNSNLNLHSYLRAGYGFISMCADWGATSDVNVRNAIACLIDKEKIIDYVFGGYAQIVDGSYGIAQWMYQDTSAELKKSLPHICFDIEQANKFLDKSPWKFEKDGKTLFDYSKASNKGDYLRYNANGEVLNLEFLGTTENSITDIIEMQFSQNATLTGMIIETTKTDLPTVVDNYYFGYSMGENRRYHLFNLSSDFPTFDDKYYLWHSDFKGTWQNATQIEDELLDKIIEKMQLVENNNKEEYLKYWVDFQIRLNQLMPEISLYSNEYFDIYSKNIKQLPTTAYADYARVITEIVNVFA